MNKLLVLKGFNYDKPLEEDQIQKSFFEEGFPNTRVGYITRLR